MRICPRNVFTSFSSQQLTASAPVFAKHWLYRMNYRTMIPAGIRKVPCKNTSYYFTITPIVQVYTHSFSGACLTAPPFNLAQISISYIAIKERNGLTRKCPFLAYHCYHADSAASGQRLYTALSGSLRTFTPTRVFTQHQCSLSRVSTPPTTHMH